MTIEQVKAGLADVLSSNNCNYAEAYNIFYVWPELGCNDGNADYSDGGYGDNTIALDCMQVDGDLVILAGWGDGFSIRRINDDASVTVEYYDTMPHASYSSYFSLALDKTRHVAYVGTYPVAGLSVYDYSGLFSGGAVSKVGTKTESDGLAGDQFSYPYYSGIAIAGDYLYMSLYDKSQTSVDRWNTQTETSDTITVSNRTGDGRYGRVQYHAASDRIIISTYYSHFWIVEDASTAGATAYQVNTVHGTPNTYGGCVVVDDDDYDIMWRAYHSYNFYDKVDIGPCAGGATATPTTLEAYADMRDQMFFGYNRIAPSPQHGSDMIFCPSDRDYNVFHSQYDHENRRRLAPPLYTTVSGGNPFYTSYGSQFVQAITDGGNVVYVFSGYGGADGNKIHTFVEGKTPDYQNSSWEIILGTFSITGNPTIATVLLAEAVGYTMTGATLSYYASNDNGSSWESISVGTVHSFTSSGYQLRIKVVGTLQPTKASYLQCVNGLNIIMSTEETEGLPTRYRLAGGA